MSNEQVLSTAKDQSGTVRKSPGWFNMKLIELFQNIVYNIFMGLALIGYCIYLIVIWYLANDFFNIETDFFEKPYEVYIVMAGVVISMITGVGGVSYGFFCIHLYRFYVKKKGERGSITKAAILNKFYANLNNNRQNL